MKPEKTHEPDEDMQNATAALVRASKRAWELAKQTRTAFVVIRNGQLVREIPPLGAEKPGPEDEGEAARI